MFWCNVDRNPHIEMAGMDGKDNSLFITEKLEWPTSITIDHPNNRLYWLDSKANIVESVRLDGTDRRVSVYFFSYYMIYLDTIKIITKDNCNLIIRRSYCAM